VLRLTKETWQRNLDSNPLLQAEYGPNPYLLYRDHLQENERVAVELAFGEFEFQFHGLTVGLSNNWLEVTRCRDGLSHRFGPGHSSELVWRAYTHAQRGWEQEPFPTFKERNEEETTETLAWLDTKAVSDLGEKRPRGKPRSTTPKFLSLADGFLNYSGPVSNHNKGLGVAKEFKTRLGEGEAQRLAQVPQEERLALLREWRTSQ
jgi:hypothetical protein